MHNLNILLVKEDFGPNSFKASKPRINASNELEHFRSLQKSLPYLNHRALFLHEKNAIDDSLSTKLQLIGTKRNYSQADLDAAVLVNSFVIH